ncbi:MAG: T9SS type A sorting domain-containing protein [bacterium]
MKKLKVLFPFVMMAMFITGALLYAHDKGQKSDIGQKNKDRSFELFGPTGQPRSTLLNINNMAQWLRADMWSSRDPRTGNSGVLFPRGLGTDAAVIFADGLIWGGLVNDTQIPVLRAGGQTYNIGVIEGRIISPGVAEDPSSPDVRIWRIRKDFATADLSLDAQELGLDVATVRAQYATDWREWPWEKGAPWTGVGNLQDSGYLGADGETIVGANNGVLDRGEDSNSNAALDPGEDVNGNGVLDGEVPGIVGADQVVWLVANDLSEGATQAFIGSPPIGLEFQVTNWGFARSDALGNMVFKQVKMIYKGTAFTPANAKIDSMFWTQWSDPDLGQYSDDFVGVDTTLSLQFVYNASSVDNIFAGFGLPPPAAGYDFFQGVLVPGVAGQDRNKNGIDDAEDTGIFNLKKTPPGFINLPMRSFGFFAAGSQISDPPFASREGTLQWWNLIRGFIPLSDPANPTRFTTNDGTPTLFPLAGDPVAGTGDNDGVILPPGDRRMLMSTGPFTLAVGDTQQLVISLMVALGSDRLSSVAVLKFFDKTAQATFDNLFQVVKPPARPKVQATGLDGEILLNWGSDPAAVAATESQDESGFKFEGYNVYQLKTAQPDLSPGNAIKLATFDVVNEITTVLSEVFDVISGTVIDKPVQIGTNSGIKRVFTVTTDAFRDKPLANDQDFFFAVTAYNATLDPEQTNRALESPPIVVTVRPQAPNPGIRLGAQIGDAIEVTHVGPSDGSVDVKVVDPTLITGDDYSVFFTVDTTGGANTPFWNLQNTTTGEILLANQTNQSGDPNIGDLNTEGLMVSVTGAPNDFKLFEVVANAAGPLVPSEGGALDFDGFPSLRPSDRQQVGEGHWAFHTGDNGGTSGGGTRGSFDAFKARVARGDNFSRIVPFDFEMRFTVDGGVAVWAFETGLPGPVPYELWNIGSGTPDDPSDDFRMIPWVLNDINFGDETDQSYDLDALDHSGSGADNDPYTDWTYWRNPQDMSPGTSGYDQFVADVTAGTYDFLSPEVMARTVLVNWNGGDVFDPTFPANVNQILPETGTIFRITSTKPNTPNDEFTFSTAAFKKTQSERLKKEDALKMVGVFPNPYLGFNRLETSGQNRFVRFNHLPAEVTIRIFNLAGTFVTELKKNDSSPWMDWNLKNANNLPIASGLYIAHVSMPGLGSKNLKLAIVLEQQFLKTF